MNSKKKKTNGFLSTRKKKCKSGNGVTSPGTTVAKPLQAWLDSIRLVKGFIKSLN